MKFNLKSNKTVHYLAISFSFLLLFILQINGYSQCASINCDGTTTSGLYPSAIGGYTSATGNYSFAGGLFSESSGQSSFSFGNRAKAHGGSSIALGQFINVTASTAIGIGIGFDLDNPLVNNVPMSFMIGMGSSKPTFFVSESIGVNLTGRIGIGNVTDPQAKLHIRADEGEDASLLLEASAGGQAKLMLSESHEMTYETDENLHFRTAQSKAFVFHQGDIFIEDIQSGIIMRSPNGQCWRGRVNDQGLLAFEQTTCPDGATSQPETIEPAQQLKVYPNPANGYIEVYTGTISGKLALNLLDANGKLLFEQGAQAGKNILKLDGLPSGAYILLLKKDGLLIESEKIVVK